ncbi:MAG: CoA transferase subunit A [Chloroflexi bacterium]|nr:CoA transferase subunit A [Chloroflexota bacterium]
MPVKSRTPKLATVDECLSLMHDGMTIATGGLGMFNKPCQWVREIAKRRIGNLILCSSPQASYDADLLIGAGLVKRTNIAQVSFDQLGLAPNFRYAAQRGLIDAVVQAEATLAGGYLAAAQGLPYHAVGTLKGNDIVKLMSFAKKYTSPLGGEELLAVPALSPDMAFIHAQEGDEFGNLRHLGAPAFDPIIARAAKVVIASVDRIISHQRLRMEPEKTTIPSRFITKIVHLPYGAHPTFSPRHYVEDEEHLRNYIQRARQSLGGHAPEAYKEYLEKYVYGPKDVFEYLELIGGVRRLTQLEGVW